MIELLNVDCYEQLLRMENNSVDLFLQDTPDLQKMWGEWLRVGKENCQFVFFGTQPFTSKLILSNEKMFKYDWIWQKTDSTNFLNARHQPLRIHEHIIVFYKKSNYHPQGLRRYDQLKKDSKKITTTNYGATKGEQYKQNFTNYPESVITFDSANNTKHPTQKPLSLIRYLIRTYSQGGGLVFDGYGGSGTTALEAHLEQRDCILCELDTDYYNAACKRFKEQTAQLKLL